MGFAPAHTNDGERRARATRFELPSKSARETDLGERVVERVHEHAIARDGAAAAPRQHSHAVR